jgi:hypothetical protein
MKVLPSFLVLSLLVGCGNSGNSGSGVSGDVANETEAPPFASGTPSRDLSVDERQATQFAASDGLAKVLDPMNKSGGEQNASFFASAYTFKNAMSQGEFDEPLNCHATRNNIAYDLMFRADGSTPSDPNGRGGSGFLSFQNGFRIELESLGCTRLAPKSGPITEGFLLKTFRGFQAYSVLLGDSGLSAAQKSELAAKSALLIKAYMTEKASSTTYKCHWDNNDDTATDALVGLDFKSGRAAVITAFAGG